MDPLSIATGIVSLSGVCIVTVKRLGEVASKFRGASKILQDVSSEAKIISISLSQLYNILVSDENAILSQALLTPDIRNALDIAFTGCSLTLSCIDSEISSLTTKIGIDRKLNFTDRTKVIWMDDKLKELLQQLHRQYNAIAILQQGLQMKVLADIVPLLKENHAAIQRVSDGTESLRGLYPHVNAAKSFIESFESPNRDEPAFSLVSERQFEFDDIITDSQAYRRVLVAATHTLRNSYSENALANGNFSDLDLEEDTSRKESSNPTTQANQARKIVAATPVVHSTPDRILQNGNDEPMTIGDRNKFVQQLRGYIDCIEGELLNSTDEAVQLREIAQANSAMIQSMNSRIEEAEKQLKVAQEEKEKDKAEHRRGVLLQRAYETQIKSLEIALVQAPKVLQLRKCHVIDIEWLERELKAQTKKAREEKEAREIERIRKMQHQRDCEAHVHELKAELQAQSKKARKDLEALEAVHHKEVESISQKFRKDHQDAIGELHSILGEMQDLAEKTRKFEHSIQNGDTTQIGSMLFIPLQAPEWYDEHIKRPTILQVVYSPETPKGWEPQWDDKKKKWLYVNKLTKKSQFQRPTMPAVKPPNLPEVSKHTPDPAPHSQTESISGTNTDIPIYRNKLNTGPRRPRRRTHGMLPF